MKMRDYQEACVDNIFQEWETVRSTLVVCPTGVGKTAIAAEVIRRIQPKRSIFMAHREELITQARDKIERFAGVPCEIEMADLYCRPDLFKSEGVVVATVQTLNSSYGGRTRMSRFKPEGFGLLVIDEAHRGVAKTYKNVINYFSQNLELKILSLTATPDRSDRLSLGAICETVAFDYEVLDAIHDGWLVPIEQQYVQINGLDFSSMRTTAGDLNNADLAAVMEAESNLHGVASASLQLVGKKRCIVFTASVKQAEMLSDIYQRHQVTSDWVCGKTPKDERRSKLALFSKGDVQIMVNCGVLTEGFDDAGVECIIMARPTKSRSLYAQMCGRSTRPLKGLVDPLPEAEQRKRAIAESRKPCCIIVDFVGNSGRHKLMSSADILNGNASEEAVARAKAIAIKKGGPVRMNEAVDQAEADIAREIKEREERKLREAARKAKVVGKASYHVRHINPFDLLELNPATERAWDKGKQLSDKQRGMLQKQGIDPEKIPYAQGRQLIAELFRRFKGQECTLGQVKVLKRYGLPIHVTKQQASSWLDAIAKNQWSLPAELQSQQVKTNENHNRIGDQDPY